jgi:hypothetical protein
MSEQTFTYNTSLNTQENSVILNTELHTLYADLEEIERRLIPLLVTVQRALGKEPSILTRAERRRG